MLAAAIVALTNAVAYMIAFSSYMSGMLGSTLDTTAVIGEALTMSDILKIRIKADCGRISIRLANVHDNNDSTFCFMILGAMATDAKSAQTLVIPIMIFNDTIYDIIVYGCKLHVEYCEDICMANTIYTYIYSNKQYNVW